MKNENEKKLTQVSLIRKYFEEHPNRDIAHPEVVDWATKEWGRETGKVFRDPDRAIRNLHQDGFLKKIGKGVYRYDPEDVKKRELEDFSAQQKKEVLERDGYKCVICGRGKEEGLELHVDHIKPKDLGGEAIILNGQTLCSQHNFLKRNLQQTETGKKMFIRLHSLAKEKGDREIQEFCSNVLQVYEEHNINGHIQWNEKSKSGEDSEEKN